MKVAFFNSAKAWGGGEKWHYEVSEALRDKGWDTVVFTGENTELFRKVSGSGQKIITVSISNFSFLNPFKLLKISWIFKKEEIKTVVINLPADLKVAGIAARIGGVKNIIYRRGSAIPVKNSLLNRFLFKKIVTNIIANSIETKNTILQHNKRLFPPEKIKVIYNGLNLKNYEPGVFNRSGNNESEIVIGNIGRMVKQKGQHYLVDLAVELKKRKVDAKIIIGGDGPLKEELISHSRQSRVSDMINFPGFVNNIGAFMSSIDIFVLPSLWEGFGYVIAEAMYFKKPVIAFNISSNPELIANGLNGFLTEQFSVKEMADKIVFFHENRKTLYEMGQNGHKFVVENLTFEKSINQFIEFLNSLR